MFSDSFFWREFCEASNLAQVQVGDYVYTTPEPTDSVLYGKVVQLERPQHVIGVPRKVFANEKHPNGGRFLVFTDGTTVEPRNGTAAAYRFILENGEPKPVPTYPACPTCGSTGPSCVTKDGKSTGPHATRKHLPFGKGGPVHVEVDGTVVATVEHHDVTDKAEPEPAKPPVGEVKSTELVDALTAVLPHTADPKAALPMLSSVHFGTQDGQLVLAATDRFTLGTYSIPWDGGEVDAIVERPKDLLAWAKKADKRAPITLTFGDGNVEASTWDGKATFRLYDGEFVKWQQILLTPESGDEWFGFNPAMLARFAKAGEKGEPMRMVYRSPLKPFRVEVGERFVGMAMPVRLPDEQRRVRQEAAESTYAADPVPEPRPAEPEPVEDDESDTDEAPVPQLVKNPCPECGHADWIHYQPEHVREDKRTCRAFTCECRTVHAPAVDTVDGSMAAAAAGESGRRVVRDAEGKVKILDWSGGERDVTTPAGRDLHISEDGDVTEMQDDEPQAVTPVAPVEKPVVTTGSRCSQCKGYGVVRKYGEFKGTHYKTAKGAAEATAKGNSMPCTSIAHGARVAA